MNVLFIQHLASGVISRNITPYSTDDLALSALYGGMRASINDTNIVHVCGMMIDDNCITYKREEWTRVPEPEPTPEPDGGNTDGNETN